MKRARWAAGALAGVGLATIGLACPSRNLDIEVDSNGLLTVLAACDAIGHICDGKAEPTCDPIFCEWHTDTRVCQIRQPCTLSNPGAHPYESNTATALQLILITADPTQLQAAGPCLCFDENDFICPDAGADSGATPADCWSASINTRLAAGIPDGLTFDGFSSPDQAVLAMAWFQPPPPATRFQLPVQSCASLPNDGTSLCVEENMVACAGLGAPPGESSYDLTCASCQGGVHSAIGNDNGPCVTMPDVCFLQTCAAALFGTGAGGAGGAGP